MAIELYPLLKHLQVGSYDNCVILTYGADLYFFEQVVWPILRSRGCYNNLVIMDSRQYESALNTASAQLYRLGKSYSAWPVSATIAFHPKLILQTNESEGRLILGSGNLTVRGFSSNWELFSEFLSASNPEFGNVFADAWKLVMECAKGATKAVRRQLEQMKATSGTVLSSEDKESWPRLLFSAPEKPSLISQLQSLIGKPTVRRLIIVAPFFDARLQAVSELEKAFGPKEVIVVVQSDTVSFPGDATTSRKGLAVHEFVPPHKSKTRYLHAKAYIIQTPTIEYCISGSANCSMAALGGEGNYEAVLVTKEKVGDGVKNLGLGASLAKAQKIDATGLKLVVIDVPPAGARLCITSAEVERGNLSVVTAATPRFSTCGEGRLKLWAKGKPIGELTVTRADNVTFSGRLNRSKDGGTVICRLVLQDEAGEQQSTPIAIHFLEDLEEATPSRLQARVHKVVEAIHSGTFEWAKSLEGVCELIMKIGLQANADGPSGKDGAGRTKKRAMTPKSKSNVGIGAYDEFVSEADDDGGAAKASEVSSLLEDVVATLRAQLLMGVTKDDEEDGSGDRDSWRYREESESEAAETGASEVQHELTDLSKLEKERVKVHRGYVRLMNGLTARYQWLRHHKNPVGPEEFWRLDAVNLLLLDGCGRLLDLAPDLGPVLLPSDVALKYLPAVATLLGRSRPVDGSDDVLGTLVDCAATASLNAGITNALRTTCALLSGLVLNWRQDIQGGDEELQAKWPHSPELVAVRCLAVMLHRNLLPTREDIIQVTERSTWLATIGHEALSEVFSDLCRLARSVVRCEHQIDVGQSLQSVRDVRPGDWVCSADHGITEVACVSDDHVEVVMIGRLENDGCIRKVAIGSLRQPNIPTKISLKRVSVTDELNHLLSYSDEDFEDWRELIMSQIRRGYFTTLEKVVLHARSEQLRVEAARQMEQNRLLGLSIINSRKGI